jgi:Family of unknown function (DUF5715)
MSNEFMSRRVHGSGSRGLLVAFVISISAFVMIAAPKTAFAVRHAEHHHRLSLYHFRNVLRGVPRYLWNPMFRPSHDSLLRQNEEIDRLDLPRIQDDDELEALKASHDLVPIEADETVRFDPRLDPSRRFCRPWTRDFVADLGEVYYSEFHDQIQVNSAVRTVMGQKKLRRRNRNAAPAEGDTASSHLAGITVDLQRRGMSKVQIHFVERYLFYLKALGLVEPEEERRQWVFHIMVAERYSDWRQTQTIFPRPPTEEPIAAPVTATADNPATGAPASELEPQP